MTNKPVEIPSAVTIVDMKTGEETHEPMSWKMVPPPPGCCQICGREHEPGQPHDRQRMYYQVAFQGMVGRAPTWADAIAHCDDRTKALWKDELQRAGRWTEPPDGEAPVKHHGVE